MSESLETGLSACSPVCLFLMGIISKTRKSNQMIEMINPTIQQKYVNDILNKTLKTPWNHLLFILLHICCFLFL